MNEDLKYYNADHPLWFHERTAHFQMNVMLMEIIELTGTEVKIFLLLLTTYRKGEAVATVCLVCDMDEDFKTFYLCISAKSANEAVALCR